MKRRAMDWHSVERHAANTMQAGMLAAMPNDWAASICAMRGRVLRDGSVPVWQKSSEWLVKLQDFRAKHGAARRWNLSDLEICDTARDVSEKLCEWLGGRQLAGGGYLHLSEVEAMDVVAIVCESMGVDVPVGLMAWGVIARVQSAVWWRRVLRKRVARVVEHGSITLGIVNGRAGAYASDWSVKRRAGQLARNAATLEKTLVKNEAGQVYKLSELAALSVANPDVRRGELMVRIRGSESFADAAGHPGLFLTLTCPSRFHAVLSVSKKGGGLRINPKYQAQNTPRDAQQWLCKMWARVRAEAAREGVKMYGIRVAEPHHDGCPHWHALLWFESEKDLQAAKNIVFKHWLSDDGNEPGAQKNRVNVKAMRAGGAAGYVAKYVAKNVGGSVNVDGHTDGGIEVKTGGVKGVERVDAWAATWGIRQFQTIGLPPVGVWRKLRAVTSDQVESARVGGDALAWRAWLACQKVGECAADFGRFIAEMGGVCLGRAAWALRVAVRVVPGVVNGYGETVTKKTIVGVEVAASGRWLISKRIAWVRVESEGAALSAAATRGGTPSAWTRFNNCTARMGGTLRAQMLGLKTWAQTGPGMVFQT